MTNKKIVLNKRPNDENRHRSCNRDYTISVTIKTEKGKLHFDRVMCVDKDDFTLDIEENIKDKTKELFKETKKAINNNKLTKVLKYEDTEVGDFNGTD